MYFPHTNNNNNNKIKKKRKKTLHHIEFIYLNENLEKQSHSSLTSIGKKITFNRGGGGKTKTQTREKGKGKERGQW